ncbi:non-ribosomal peptide synthetase module [Paenibacillus sp. MBLB4367]|uniref:non-ribosomal peptide synthetase module n=1 Tax=Paenibacillus sp. MBLB4367 TaxID=3384767 RepID=UPI0039080A8C
MAQRLATEYVKTCLELTEAEMSRFIAMFQGHQNLLQVKVLENGSQEVVFMDRPGDQIALSFERKMGKYVFEGSCRFTNPNLVNLMRKALSDFKGSAIVNRIYTGYTMVYQYAAGTVVRIVELKGNQEKIVYEYKDTIGEFERMFRRSEAEREIQKIWYEIDHFLDLRNQSGEKDAIDEHLKMLAHRLFVLEA